MKHNWHPEELSEHWTVNVEEKQLARRKRHPLQLGYVVLLKFFQYQGRFPKSAREVPRRIIKHIANQLEIAPANWSNYDWSGRTSKYHRSEIRKLPGFREADSEELTDWLCEHCLAEIRRTERIEDAAYERLRALHIEPPTSERLSRLIRSALHQFDQRLCKSVLKRLPASICKRLEALLDNIDDQEAEPVRRGVVHCRSCERITKEDWRALTPLFYLHINPYGEFSLDMTTRLGIEDTVTV